MDVSPRHDRTVRLLAARLEALATAWEHTPGGVRLDGHIHGAVVAMRHAVELELLSPEEAGAIWEAVARRHPRAEWCRGGPPLAA